MKITEQVFKISLLANGNKTEEFFIGKSHQWLLIPPLSCREEIFFGIIKEKQGVVNSEIKFRLVLTQRYGTQQIINYSSSSIYFRVNSADYVSFHLSYDKIKTDIEIFAFLTDNNLVQHSYVRTEKAENGVVFCEVVNQEMIASAYDVYEVFRQDKKILKAAKFSDMAIYLALKLDIMLVKRYPLSINMVKRRIENIIN